MQHTTASLYDYGLDKSDISASQSLWLFFSSMRPALGPEVAAPAWECAKRPQRLLLYKAGRYEIQGSDVIPESLAPTITWIAGISANEKQAVRAEGNL